MTDTLDGQYHWLRQQSAFTIRDLLNVARADEPYARLEHIYEWYFERTMTAIRVAFGAAVGASAAIYGLVKYDKLDHEKLVTSGLTAAAAVCVAAGVIQRRELAQLHREFAAALRLLSDVRRLPECVRSAPDDPLNDDSLTAPASEWRKGLAMVGAALVAVMVGVAAAVAFVIEFGTPTWGLTVVGFVVVLLGGLHIMVELWPSKPSELISGSTLEEAAGHFRLDDYALVPSVTSCVNRAINERRESWV